MVVMENHEYDSIIGSADAPYLNQLASGSALAQGYYATTHPSLTNYLTLISGSDQGVRDDGEDYVLDAPTIVDQLEGAGLTWRAYMEGLPTSAGVPCAFPTGGEGYHKKHNPFAYFRAIQQDPARCARVVPLTQLGADLASGLPNFAFITPDQCHDMHDCSTQDGDAWLQQTLPSILDRLGGGDLLVVVFDEGTSDVGGGGHIPCILAGPGARPGARSPTTYTHRSLLRTIEKRLGLPALATVDGPDVLTMDDLLL
jgi:hypothetical protein